MAADLALQAVALAVEGLAREAAALVAGASVEDVE